MITQSKIIAAADKAGWGCDIEKIKKDDWHKGGYFVSFRTDTYYGQDVCYEYEVDTLKDVIDKVRESNEDYDVDEETYLWLDSSGHPKNGAPSFISELVKDMEEKGELLEKLNDELQKLI